MWKLAAERAAREEEAAKRAPVIKIPEGFQPLDKATALHFPDGHWYYSEKNQLFWNGKDQKFYVWDSAAGRHVQLHESKAFKHRIFVGHCVHEEASQVKHVMIHDLAKAAHALRLSVDHLDRPCSLYALYEGHRGTASSGVGNLCA